MTTKRRAIDLLNDPELAALTIIIVDRLKPRMVDAVKFADLKYPESTKRQAVFVTGAIYGICSSWMHDNEGRMTVTGDNVACLAAAACQFVDLLYSSEFNGDWDLLSRRLVPEVFAEGGAS